MHRIERSVLVPYSAEQMFALIAGVEGYARFLPSCVAARQVGVDADHVDATIEIAYHGVRARFTTRNRLEPPTSIRLEFVDGPFKRLSGAWSIAPLGDAGCRVHLLLQYEFAAGALGRAIAPAFERVAGSFVDAFVREARQRHE